MRREQPPGRQPEKMSANGSIFSNCNFSSPSSLPGLHLVISIQKQHSPLPPPHIHPQGYQHHLLLQHHLQQLKGIITYQFPHFWDYVHNSITGHFLLLSEFITLCLEEKTLNKKEKNKERIFKTFRRTSLAIEFYKHVENFDVCSRRNTIAHNIKELYDEEEEAEIEVAEHRYSVASTSSCVSCTYIPQPLHSSSSKES